MKFHAFIVYKKLKFKSRTVEPPTTRQDDSEVGVADIFYKETEAQVFYIFFLIILIY